MVSGLANMRLLRKEVSGFDLNFEAAGKKACLLAGILEIFRHLDDGAGIRAYRSRTKVCHNRRA